MNERGWGGGGVTNLVDLLVGLLQRFILLLVQLSNDGGNLRLVVQDDLSLLHHFSVLKIYTVHLQSSVSEEQTQMYIT